MVAPPPPPPPHNLREKNYKNVLFLLRYYNGEFIINTKTAVLC